MEKEDSDRAIERKVWSECFLCEEEYSEDVRINKECLHSYCKECIEQTATTSQICPICHSPLPSPLSLLPLNDTLLHWQTLFPKQIIKINLSLLDKSTERKCQQCEKSVVEIICDECKTEYCSSCSQQIHSFKQFANHKLRKINGKDFSKAKDNFSNNFTEFYKCSLHSNEEMKLYCKDCNQFVCVYCIDQSHSDHKQISVTRFVDEIKEKWKTNIDSSKSTSPPLKNFLSRLSSNEKLLKESIKRIDDEIDQLEDKLKLLKVKREGVCEELDENEAKDNKRIRDFFEENNLSNFFLRLLPDKELGQLASINVPVAKGRVWTLTMSSQYGGLPNNYETLTSGNWNQPGCATMMTANVPGTYIQAAFDVPVYVSKVIVSSPSEGTFALQGWGRGYISQLSIQYSKDDDSPFELIKSLNGTADIEGPIEIDISDKNVIGKRFRLTSAGYVATGSFILE